MTAAKSWSGVLVGAALSIAAGGFIALMGGPNARDAAANGLGSGASMGGLCSTASNAKRTAAFVELQA